MNHLCNFIKQHMPKSWNLIIDLPDQNYSFFSSVVQTMLRPDIVLWCQNSRQTKLLELTVCFEEISFPPVHTNSPSTVSLFQHVGKLVGRSAFQPFKLVQGASLIVIALTIS